MTSEPVGGRKSCSFKLKTMPADNEGKKYLIWKTHRGTSVH